ncbi:MAG: hypothetical protein FWF57_03040 [Defluviitaleaceae bacterium]|nr:hypothetical protein [Defluviitaleaceae bacterium]
MEYFKINDNLIFREEDYSVFSLEKMEIYQFNEIGYKVILEMKKRQQLKRNDIISIYNEYDDNDVNIFIETIINSGVLLAV